MDLRHDFDGINDSIIEVVSSDSTLGLLKRSGNKNIIVSLPLSLSIGKLDSITPFNRTVLSQYYKEDNSYDFSSDFDNLKKITNNCSKIRVCQVT